MRGDGVGFPVPRSGRLAPPHDAMNTARPRPHGAAPTLRLPRTAAAWGAVAALLLLLAAGPAPAAGAPLVAPSGRAARGPDGAMPAGMEVGARSAGAAVGPSADGRRLFLPAVQARPQSAPVVPDVPRGVYGQPFRLTLRTATPRAVIRFTVDGTLPDQANGLTYLGPLDIARSTVIRAAAFRDGFHPGPVSTHTYVVLDDVLAQSDRVARERGLPSAWGTYPEDSRLSGHPVPALYGMQPGVLIHRMGTLHADLQALPSMSVVTAMDDMFGPQGLYANPMARGMERPGSMEWLPWDGSEALQIDCGVRIAGGFSRRADVTRKHSFSLRFRSRYGASRLRMPLFPDSPVASFDVLRLRAGQADAFYFFADKGQYAHDEWGRRTQLDMGWLSARGRFVHLYVNGLYWGIYNVTEEPTAAFASDHLGGAEGDWDVLKDGSEAVDGAWPPEVEDGHIDTYQELLDVVAASPAPDPADPGDRLRYARVSDLLDLEQHADYILLQIYGANFDWPNKNWRAARDRKSGGGFQFFVWDYEHTTALRDNPSRSFCLPVRDPITRECGFNADTPGVGGLHGWLRRFPDYRVLFADRVKRHLLDPGGALRPEAAAARYADLTAELGAAIVGEAARWGTGVAEYLAEREQMAVWHDYRARHGRVPQTPAMWAAERQRLLEAYYPPRSQQVLGQLCREGLYPAVAAPVIDVGPVEPGGRRRVAVGVGTVGCPGAATEGTLYVTRDGADPRAPGGAVAPSARPYTGPFSVSGYADIRVRLLAGTAGEPLWSALAHARFGSPRLAITEIMYHPATDAAAEFLELHNLEIAPVDLAGFSVSNAVRYSFPAGSSVGPRGHVVLVRDARVFAARYPGVPFLAAFGGRLDNSGETIEVLDPEGRLVTRVRYGNDGLWPLGAAGLGWSLVPAEDAVDPSDPESWRASTAPGGSPGGPDPAPPFGRGRAVINEVLAHPGPAQDGAIELHNPSRHPIDVSGWFLGPRREQPLGYRLGAGKVLAPGAYHVVYGRDLAAAGLHLDPFGGALYLSSADADGNLTGHLAGFAYEPAEAGRSTGRVATAAGARLSVLQRPTFGIDHPAHPDEFRTGRGAPNAAPFVGQVVVHELMYQPAGDGPEFLELHNRTGAPVALHAPDGRPWRLSEGVRFSFPPGSRLPPGGMALVVPSAPEAFRAAVPVPEEVTVYGPYEGRLSNDGETVRLVRPWHDAPGGRGGLFLTVDVVDYGVASPWPAAAAGGGPSLERLTPGRFGSDPYNWLALTAGGTPGLANTRPHRAYLPLALDWR